MKIDNFLKDLVLDTPSSKEKLVAAWDGLSVESQIKILLALRNADRSYAS